VTVDPGAPPIGGRARSWSRVWLAWLASAGVLAVVAVAVGLWLVVHHPVPGATGYAYWREALINGLAFATVGVLVASRRPEHPIGWLFLGAGLAAVGQVATGEYAAAFLAASGPSAGVAVAAWVSYQLQLAVVGVLAGLLVLFPTGRPPSRRWWVLVWVIGAGAVLTWVGEGLAPARYEDFPGVANPFGIAALATALGWVAAAGTLLASLGVLGALGSLLVRFARARGLERQQLKWFVYAAGVGLAMLLLLGESGVAASLVWRSRKVNSADLPTYPTTLGLSITHNHVPSGWRRATSTVTPPSAKRTDVSAGSPRVRQASANRTGADRPRRAGLCCPCSSGQVGRPASALPWARVAPGGMTSSMTSRIVPTALSLTSRPCGTTLAAGRGPPLPRLRELSQHVDEFPWCGHMGAVPGRQLHESPTRIRPGALDIPG
jgi:hypothetical protein